MQRKKERERERKGGRKKESRASINKSLEIKAITTHTLF